MKSNMARIMQVVLFVTALCISMSSAAKAQTPKCTPALIAGKWTTSMSGIFGGAPFVAMEMADVDAQGKFTSKITSNLYGSPSTHGINTGTISAYDDCTATANWTSHVCTDPAGCADDVSKMIEFGTGTADMVADDDMREIRFVFTSYTLADGTNVLVNVKGEGRRVFRRSTDQQ